MDEKTSSKNRLIKINKGVVGPSEPRPRTVRPKSIGDYPGVPQVYLEVAKNYSSPLLFGPPICDELMALIQHMFTEDEARVARYLKPLSRKTAQEVAGMEHRPVEEVRGILEGLAGDKHVLLSYGPAENRRYAILPVVPGTFESVMIRTSLESLTDWHRRFAELFEALWETGYVTDYIKHPAYGVRYLPVGQSISVHPMALPSDRLEEILDEYKSFGVGLCQCRVTENIVGRGCGRPLEVCSVFGEWAERGIREGRLRRVDKKEMLEIKANAEASGLVTWMMNHDSRTATNISCSCCGCCCHMMRTISEFNMPGMIAPPHFRPVVDLSKCDYCAKCALACPMGAVIVDTKNRIHLYQPERCIGCGLCVLACDKREAIQMEPVPDYKQPPQSWSSLLARLFPNYLRNVWSGWREQKKLQGGKNGTVV